MSTSIPVQARRLFQEYATALHAKGNAADPAGRVIAHHKMMAILDEADRLGYKVAYALEALIEENLK